MSCVMHFDSTFSFEKSIHILGEVITGLRCANADVLKAIDRKDWEYLVNIEVDFLSESSPDCLKARRQIQAFFSKNASLPLGRDTAAEALAKFKASEEMCKRTNARFYNRSLPFSQGGLDAGLIFQVQRKIAAILGPFPGIHNFDYGFGPGANVGLSRFTSVRRKLSARPTLTPGAYRHVRCLQASLPFWDLRNFEVVQYGKYATVPKNAKTDRSILVEPIVNAYLQKGVGSYIRDRLLRVGVDLTDQTVNQEYARRGSIDGSIATLDLAAASDTISREVVAELLPLEWWIYLNDIRSQYVRFPDGTVKYLEKFSSMGNGFTFELESLIFYAICKVLDQHPKLNNVSVYGDDLIVNTADVDLTVAGLREFGFSVNSEKSFSEGCFRESCGKDFFAGCNVRPCYVKTLLSVKELFRLHNFFFREGEYDQCTVLKRHIPTRYLIYGPDGFGDGHLLGDHPFRRSKQMRQSSSGLYHFRTYSSKPIVRREPLDGDYAAFLYKCTEGASSDIPASVSMYYERGSSKYRLTRVCNWV